MSGGHFDYEDEQIGWIAHKIEQLIERNDSAGTNELGARIGYGFSKETVEQLQTAKTLLEIAQIYAHRIDWLVSGDDSEESFHKRLEEGLATMKQKYAKAPDATK